MHMIINPYVRQRLEGELKRLEHCAIDPDKPEAVEAGAKLEAALVFCTDAIKENLNIIWENEGD